MTADARTELRTALANYRRCCAEYRSRAAAWDRRYTDRPLVAASRKSNDPVLYEIAADIGMYRSDVVMWAEVVRALKEKAVAA